MLKKLLLVPFLLLGLAAAARQKDTCKVDVYLTSIYDLNLSESSVRSV